MPVPFGADSTVSMWTHQAAAGRDHKDSSATRVSATGTETVAKAPGLALLGISSAHSLRGDTPSYLHDVTLGPSHLGNLLALEEPAIGGQAPLRFSVTQHPEPSRKL